MIELTTKVQDQPRGSAAQTVALNPSAELAKTIHEQLLAAVLLDCGDKREGVYMVTTHIEVRMYVKAFDQPFANPALDETIDDLELSVRASNILDSAGIKMVGDLVKLSERDLLRLRHCGRTSLREIVAALASRGLTLRQSEPLP